MAAAATVHPNQWFDPAVLLEPLSFGLLKPVYGHVDYRYDDLLYGTPSWWTFLAERFRFDVTYFLFGAPWYFNEAFIAICFFLPVYYVLRRAVEYGFLRNQRLFSRVSKRFSALCPQNRSFVISQATFFLQFVTIPFYVAYDFWSGTSQMIPNSRMKDPVGLMGPVMSWLMFYLGVVYIYDTFVLVLVGRFGKSRPVGYAMLVLHHLMCDSCFIFGPAAHSGGILMGWQVIFQATHAFYHFSCVYSRIGVNPSVKKWLSWLHQNVHLLGMPIPIIVYQGVFLARGILYDGHLDSFSSGSSYFAFRFCLYCGILPHFLLYAYWVYEAHIAPLLSKSTKKSAKPKDH
eukprot:ANDGO_00697.mRNA.1 hypothetical protein